MIRLCRLLTAALLLIAPAARGQTQTDLLNGFDNFTIHDPIPHDGKVANYGATGPNPHWSIAQWDIPGGKLSPFIRHDEAGQTEFDATALESAVQVIEAPAGPIVMLSQNGAALPCSQTDGRPRESDLFIGTPVIAQGLKNTPLTGLIALHQMANISSVGGPSQPSKSCAVNKGGAIISVIVSDEVVQPHQVFFYQFAVSTVCRQQGNGPPCNTSHADVAYYANKEPYGADDYLPLLGLPMISGANLTTLNIDLLPRLLHVIKVGPASLDHDPSHWVVTSVYAGQHIWGDLTLKTGWQNYRLVAETP